jgi:hypothetical protein
MTTMERLAHSLRDRASGASRRSASPVDPSTSQNSTVTVFRASWSDGSSTGSGEPQDMQNSARAGLLWPHAGHSGMG